MKDTNPDQTDAREATILLYAQLMIEAQALGAALLDHDADDAHARAIQIASVARSRELTGVALLADDLAQRIAKRRDRPGVGVGGAYEELTETLEQLLNDAEAAGPVKNG